ncbi:MAG: 50S ribosomal protein L9 [Thermorudis peleae]|nr:50S ribosomal protein L9 [Thermorudis peleae]
MKVILLQDVNPLGEAGAIVTVSDGYARNFLIPRGLAEPASPSTLKAAEQRLAAERRRIAREEEAQRALAERLNGLRIVIAARVGERGRLYGSITAQDIADRLSETVGEAIDRRRILLDEPIRSIGEHPVTVQLAGRLRPVVTVVVTSPEEAAETTAPAASTAATAQATEEPEG